MTALITDHVFRDFKGNKRRHVGECRYMNCRRPRSEHERADSGRGLARWQR